MRRCAAILEYNPETKKEEYRIIRDPTIGDIRLLRTKGAIIMREIRKRYGNEIHSTWVTDSGRAVVERIDFI